MSSGRIKDSSIRQKKRYLKLAVESYAVTLSQGPTTSPNLSKARKQTIPFKPFFKCTLYRIAQEYLLSLVNGVLI